MTYSGSLRQRLVLVFSSFGLVLAVLSGGLLYSVYHDSEDAVQRRFLEAELARYLEMRKLREPSQEIVVLDRFVTVYEGLSAVPGTIRAAVPVTEPGYHELGDAWLAPDSAGASLVLVTRAPDGGLLVLALDTTAFEASESLSARLMVSIGVAVAMVAVVGAALGGAVARSIVTPVVRLADTLRSGLPEGGPAALDPSQYPAEVGTLAQALRQSFDRIGAFVERERQFTANASHELRTPVTVMTGAAELLAAHPDAASPALARPLERIRRATTAMEEIIEVFLLLAREDTVRAAVAPTPLDAVVADVIDQLRPLVHNRPVDLISRVPAGVLVEGNERVLSIVLGNLVRNALQRTERGHVVISGGAEGLVITDSGPGIPPELLDRVTGRGVRGASGGYGLGLAIVRALCDRCGWRVVISSVEGEGTSVELRFS